MSVETYSPSPKSETARREEEGKPSKLEIALRQAEANIDTLVEDKETTQWDMRHRNVGGEKQEWVVGENKGVADDDAEILVRQALGPNAANGEVFYGAETPVGKVYWQAGADKLGDLRYGPEREASTYAVAALALNALHRVNTARPIHADNSEHVR